MAADCVTAPVAGRVHKYGTPPNKFQRIHRAIGDRTKWSWNPDDRNPKFFFGLFELFEFFSNRTHVTFLKRYEKLIFSYGYVMCVYVKESNLVLFK